ncbi:PEP-CTERM sorting domain-containing protein [bacterium]|jgi:hypothetical protein|nr:PEP-CTERM sorting domain-containing protein [bacterium]
MRQNINHLPAAAILVASFTSVASAALIHFPDQNIPIPTTFAGVTVDLESGLVSNDLEGFSAGDANFLLGGLGITNDADEDSTSPSWQPVRSAANNTDPIVSLGIGAVVSGALLVGDDFGASFGANSHFPAFPSGTPGFIGFQLELDDATLVNGWMEVTLQDDNTPGIIHQWAFEDSGASIRVGQIPEPGQTVLSLIGLTLLALRRRK